jgi:Fe-S cluster biogenesis protein NfuA
MAEDLDVARITTAGPLFERVNAALDDLRPALQADGGDVRLVELEDESIAIVEMLGKCAGCPISEMTMRYGIAGHLRSEVPEIIGVDVVQEAGVDTTTGFVEALDRTKLV